MNETLEYRGKRTVPSKVSFVCGGQLHKMSLNVVNGQHMIPVLRYAHRMLTEAGVTCPKQLKKELKQVKRTVRLYKHGG